MNLSNLGLYYGPMNGYDPNYGWIGPVWGLLSFIVFILVVVFVVRALSGHGRYYHHHWQQGEHRDPLDIAKERYAKGDITKEQLADIKKELSGK